VNDLPSVEVEAPDDSSLKGKDKLNKTEDAVATPATVQEQKQKQKHSQALENGDKKGTFFLIIKLCVKPEKDNHIFSVCFN